MRIRHISYRTCVYTPMVFCISLHSLIRDFGSFARHLLKLSCSFLVKGTSYDEFFFSTETHNFSNLATTICFYLFFIRCISNKKVVKVTAENWCHCGLESFAVCTNFVFFWPTAYKLSGLDKY